MLTAIKTEPISTSSQSAPEKDAPPPEEVEESSDESDSTPSDSGEQATHDQDQTATLDLSASLASATIQDNIPTNDSNVTEADMAKEFPRESLASGTPSAPVPQQEPLFEESDSESDDGEGEWITPSNVALHKSRALNLVPDNASKPKAPVAQIAVGCMTADFAMQNVLLQMGLNLIDVQGKRIATVKSWVLRCHACFK